MKNYTQYLLIIILSICACKEDQKVDCNVFEWGYEGESGPAFWEACHEDCDGEVQSPVDLSGAIQDNTLLPLSINYSTVPVNLVNNGHTVEFEYEEGSHITFDGVEYELVQFHFHAQSEHTVGGQYYPLEAHLVHKNEASGDLAVIGVFFETGGENTFLQNFINDLPDEVDEHFQSATTINAYGLLPAELMYYTYNGSLTTPPCSEIVNWIVLKTPIQISSSQLEKFIHILHNNNRPVQPLHGRQIRASI